MYLSSSRNSVSHNPPVRSMKTAKDQNEINNYEFKNSHQRRLLSKRREGNFEPGQYTSLQQESAMTSPNISPRNEDRYKSNYNV